MPYLVLSLCLAFWGPSDDVDGDQGALSPEITLALEKAAGDDPARRQEALRLILSPENSEVLPHLMPLMELSDESARRDITLAILSRAPDRAADFFISALAPGSLDRREAAVHGLGRSGDSRTVSILQPYLTVEEPRLRQAALRGFISVIREAVGGALMRATGRMVPRKPGDLQKLEEVRQALLTARAKPGDHTELSIVLRKIVDTTTCKGLVDGFLESIEDDRSQLRDTLSGIRSRNHRWLGRPDSNYRDFSYTFTMENRMAGAVKQVEISADSLDVADLFFWGYDLNRVCRLKFASDLLLIDPAGCSPEITRMEGKPAQLRLQIPDREVFRAGIGILNIAYWEAVIANGKTSVIDFDPVRFRITGESIFDSDGKLLIRTTFSDWQELPDRSETPGTVVSDLFSCQIAGKERNLRFRCAFQMTEGNWFLRSAETEEILDDSGELRALGSVGSLTLTPLAPPQSEKDGESNSESRGQGSRAGSPRR